MFVENVKIDVGFIYDRGFDNGVYKSFIRNFTEFQIDDQFIKELKHYYKENYDDFDYLGFTIKFYYKGHKFDFSYSNYLKDLDNLIFILNEMLFDLKSNKCKWLLHSVAFIDYDYYEDIELYDKMAEVYKS